MWFLPQFLLSTCSFTKLWRHFKSQGQIHVRIKLRVKLQLCIQTLQRTLGEACVEQWTPVADDDDVRSVWKDIILPSCYFIAIESLTLCLKRLMLNSRWAVKSSGYCNINTLVLITCGARRTYSPTVGDLLNNIRNAEPLPTTTESLQTSLAEWCGIALCKHCWGKFI